MGAFIPMQKVKRYLLTPRFHLSRVEFNLLALFFITIGLVAGTYLTLFHVFPSIFAFNDTNKVWTFSTATAGDYTYDSTFITVDNTGAHPVTGVNKLSNPSFTSNNSSWSVAALPPSGWIEVPGNGTYSTTNFLAMKYEAKCAATSDLTTGLTTAANTYADSTTACTSANSKQVVSVASGNPIVDVSQLTAITRCSAVTLNGNAAHLQTNNEWMTMARNAEAVATNWTGNSVGSGVMYSGHNDNSPSTSLVGSIDDAAGYTNTGNSISSSPGQKRTLSLSNGAVIWDMPGDVWEWTNNTILRRDQPVAWNGTTDDATGFNWSDYSVGSLSRYIHTYKGGSNLQYVDAGPANTSYNANQAIGRIYHYSNSADIDTTSYAFLRGGGLG